jgi:vesicle-associated membrane protein 7
LVENLVQVTKVKEIMMENSGKALDKGQKLDVMVEVGSTPESGHHLQKSASARLHAHRMWWSNVKLVLILDAVVCAILFAIWLGICKGFQCVK